MATLRKGSWVGGLSGKVGNVYLAETRYGTQLRAMPERRQPPTPGESAQRARVRAVAAAWRDLDGDAMRAWASYAQALTLAQPEGARRPVSGYNAFSSLGSKLLQIGREGDLPSQPPKGPFLGDAVVVTASPSFACERGEQDGERGSRALSTPNPLLSPGRKEGALVFSAAHANASGVLTELLLQPLANAARAIRPKGYVSRGFVAFTPEGLSATVAAEPGWVACAYRFVLEATGQESALLPCGVVRVG